MTKFKTAVVHINIYTNHYYYVRTALRQREMINLQKVVVT